MTAAQLIGLFAVWVVAVVSPGPDIVVVLQRALSGRRHGLATALGIVAGLSVWLTAAFAGVATLVRVYPQAMTVLQVTGGLLLATLGVLGLRSWRRARNPLPAVRIRYRDRGSESAGRVADSRVGGAALPPRADFARGLATNLANPKALVFFGAVLTPFLQGEMSAGSSVAVVVGMIAVALVWFGGLALIASHRVVNDRVGRWMPWIDLIASVIFVVAGVAFVIDALT